MDMGGAVLDRFEAIDLTPVIGTEIRADAETLLGGRYATQIRDLLSRRGVLVFRQLNFDDEQQRTFTATLGDMLLQMGEKVINVSLDRKVNGDMAEYQKGSLLWHIDMMNYDVPCFASIMTARKLSETGGQTEFASTYAAWDALPEADKAEYEGLRCMHALEATQLKINPEPSLADLERWRANVPSKVQPLVWRHLDGRKSLVIGATALYVMDKTPEESAYILTKLRDWTTQSRFVYHHEWTPGDMIMWDNTGTMHRALPYPFDSGRLMRRTALAGLEPVA
jgi:alpha-ketoglutarate-dependent taurine dioxygenase